jgi:hypothetical protein
MAVRPAIRRDQIGHELRCAAFRQGNPDPVLAQEHLWYTVSAPKLTGDPVVGVARPGRRKRHPPMVRANRRQIHRAQARLSGRYGQNAVRAGQQGSSSGGSR